LLVIHSSWNIDLEKLEKIDDDDKPTSSSSLLDPKENTPFSSGSNTVATLS
jgi:hypothetical protein